MPFISSEIPQQHYELIRDRIALIIYQELQNQWALYNDNDLQAPMPNPDISITPESIRVFVDRIIPIDESECPVINVIYNGAQYNVENSLRAEGLNTFFIDVYTKAFADEFNDADQLANIKLQKILGKIGFIFRHSLYQTLSFAPGFIGGTKVQSIQIGDPKDASLNLNGCVMGRIVLEVRATEYVTPMDVRNMNGFFTTVKLFNSNKGYLYIDQY